MGDNEAFGGSKLPQQWKPGQGGLRATMFIYVLTAFENMGFVANISSLVLYFHFVMHYSFPDAANTLTNLMGSTFLLALLGGFISDTYLTRLNTCLVFGVLEVLALMIITIQAHYPKLLPEPCGPLMLNCKTIGGSQELMFYISLGLFALGAGGARGSLPALGGDQFDRKDPKENKALASYFNWFLLSLTLGASFGVTFIVKISMVKGWDVGFFIAMLGSFVGYAVLAFGSPFYRVRLPGGSPILSIIQVIVVAFKNRKLKSPEENLELYEISDKELPEDYDKIPTSHQFRCLDKAAILPKDSVPRPWEVCTVTEVEKVKIIIRMLPIIASTILMNTCLAQLQTFSVQQGSTMNLYLGSLEVPASSIPVIPLVFMTILVPIYEYIFIPFAQKITHHPSGITQLQRVGVGLVLSAISMGVAGIVEVKRRNQDIKDPTKNISLFWLSFQYCIFGIADMFTLVGLMEFFYKEAPSGMKSLSTSFTFLSLAIGYFLSSIFVSAINSITKMGRRKTGWLAGATLNESRLDLFYWFLAMLSCLNFANYLIWASWYKYKSDDNSSATIGLYFHKEESNEAVEAKPNSPASPIDSWLKDEASEKAPEGVKTMQNSPSSRNHTA